MNSCLVKEQVAFGIVFLPNDMLIRWLNIMGKQGCHCDWSHIALIGVMPEKAHTFSTPL
jgi:hypothetical protein